MSYKTRKEVLPRSEIEALIADGHHIVVYEGKVLKLDNWLDRHPGGDTAIFHVVGRDATDEINAYHSDEALATMGAYQIGITGEKIWENFLPPIQGGVFRKRGSIAADEGISLSSSASSSSQEAVTQKAAPIFTNEQIQKAQRLQLIEDDENRQLQHDLEIFPSLDYKTQTEIGTKYKALYKRVEDAGLFEPNYRGYFSDFLRISTMFGLAWYLFDKSMFISAICLGLGWHQLVFIAHDAGHIGITHGYQMDNWIGMTIAAWIGGLSLGWWKRNHNVHHIITNDPVHDPDIQHLPVFAVSNRFFSSVKSTYYNCVLKYDIFARYLIPLQHMTYYPILCLGRFNLYALSWGHVLLGKGPRHGKAAWFRWYELMGLSFFAYWFFYLIVFKSIPTAGQRWMYVLVSHVATMPVHVQITLSHFAMSTQDLGLSESFAQRQLRTTMDVDCPAWLDFLHGGLQFQAIHHLFPRMPRHNLRRAQRYVLEYCKDIGVEYHIYGFVHGNQHVIGKLGQIAKQAEIFRDCERHLREEHVAEMTEAK